MFVLPPETSFHSSYSLLQDKLRALSHIVTESSPFAMVPCQFGDCFTIEVKPEGVANVENHYLL